MAILTVAVMQFPGDTVRGEPVSDAVKLTAGSGKDMIRQCTNDP